MMCPPPPCLIICLAASWVPKNALLRLTCSTFSYCSSVVSSTDVRSLDAAIVEHNIDPAERLHCGIDQALKIGDLANIRLHADGLIAERGDLLFEFLGCVWVGDIVDHDLSAFLGQFESYGLADTAITTSPMRIDVAINQSTTTAVDRNAQCRISERPAARRHKYQDQSSELQVQLRVPPPS